MSAYHVREAFARYATEVTPGTRETGLGSGDDFPQILRNLSWEIQERVVNDAQGPGSRLIQSQEILSARYPFSYEFDIYNGDFLNYLLWDSVNFEVYSLTYAISAGAQGGWGVDLWGAKADTIRINIREEEALSASVDGLAMHSAETSGFTWDNPTNRPYVFARGTINLSTGGGDDLTSCDITIENNLVPSYAMQDALPAAALIYDPKYLVAGFFDITADVTTRDVWDTSSTNDTIQMTLVFTSGANTLTITLTGGMYRSNRGDASRDDLIGFTVPMRFRDLTIVES
jgi:hypothetical protein